MVLTGQSLRGNCTRTTGYRPYVQHPSSNFQIFKLFPVDICSFVSSKAKKPDMKTKCLILLFLVLSSQAFAGGIVFEHGTWADIVKKATAANKPISVDFNVV